MADIWPQCSFLIVVAHMAFFALLARHDNEAIHFVPKNGGIKRWRKSGKSVTQAVSRC